LRDAVRLATEGRGDSARALVRRRLATTSPTDSTYAEVLYTAGVVASNPDTALRYLRRTSVEYSQSGWADRALLRIAQIAFASGDASTTYSTAQRVLSDYPFSTVRPQAAYWAGRAQIDLGNLVSACRLLSLAADSARDDVELANRARFYVQRCSGVAVAKPDSVVKDSTAPVASTSQMGKPADSQTGKPATSPPSAYAIQVSAVRSAAAADQSMQLLKRAGYDPRVNRDPDGLLKVRVGRYKTRAEAQRIAAEIRRKLNLAPFVVEEP